jgi:hypothetical protein
MRPTTPIKVRLQGVDVSSFPAPMMTVESRQVHTIVRSPGQISDQLGLSMVRTNLGKARIPSDCCTQLCRLCNKTSRRDVSIWSLPMSNYAGCRVGTDIHWPSAILPHSRDPRSSDRVVGSTQDGRRSTSE